MNKEKNVLDFYTTCYKLKNIVRTGWTQWNVDKERLESVAEHIFGTQMLALAMYSEYEYDIDIKKVIMMLAVHELEETIIGDLVFFQITKEEKLKKGHEAVEKILSNLLSGEEIKNLIFEFDERSTKEAFFAYQCDKLECDIQCKIYDEEGGFKDASKAAAADEINDPEVRERIVSGQEKLSTLWITNDQKRLNYDNNFNSIADYIIANDIMQ